MGKEGNTLEGVIPRGSTWYCSISGTVPQRHRNFCTRGRSVGGGEGGGREQVHGLARKSGLTGPLATDAGHAQAPGITSQEQQRLPLAGEACHGGRGWSPAEWGGKVVQGLGWTLWQGRL